MRAPRRAVDRVVFDASAVLAVIFDEAGAAELVPLLPGAIVPAVNLAEAAGKLADHGYTDAEIAADLAKFRVHNTSRAVAMAAGALRRPTQKLNFSLADRISLATAKVLNAPMYTGDRPWKAASLDGIKVVWFR